MAQAFIGARSAGKTVGDLHYCHARARAASVSLHSVEMRENQATACIFFKKQQVLE
jgi:hypothetical protein